MPWKLVPPRKGKTPYWYIRGKYLGIALDDSTGATEERAARRIIKTWREQAERGEFRKKPSTEPAPATFLSAAVAYMQAGGERQYVQPILAKSGETALVDIDQITIDTLATELYPDATAATRNRQVYTPISAILKRAGIDRKVKRPLGWRGRKATKWLEPVQAFAAFAAADRLDAEFGLFLRVLCYTGMRLSEAINIRLGELNLERQTVYLPETKNDDPRPVYIPNSIVVALANHPRGLDRNPAERLFRFHVGGRLRDMLKATWQAAGIALPRRQAGFHVWCHTWGTWMRRYGGLDTWDLVDTERWRDPTSAQRYAHTEPGEMARRAEMLPTEAPKRGAAVERKDKTG
jgi:integrase